MSTILNLKQYSIVFATSFETNHGITGHLYEMIEYYTICRQNGINAGIALLDGVTKDLLSKALDTKYDFTEQEKLELLSNVVEHKLPKILIANNICFVDGAPRFYNCVIYADNVFLLRCWDGPLDYFHNHKSIKRTHLLQDFNVYTERYEDLNIEVVDYVKKLLWDRYVKPADCPTKTALFYMMNRCKARPAHEVTEYINKQQFESYVIATDTPERYQHLASDKVSVEVAPIKDLFSRFSTYIYTPVTKVDCSPRFVVECAAFGRDVIYEIDYFDPGLEARRRATPDELLLTQNDDFVKYVQQFIN